MSYMFLLTSLSLLNQGFTIAARRVGEAALKCDMTPSVPHFEQDWYPLYKTCGVRSQNGIINKYNIYIYYIYSM